MKVEGKPADFLNQTLDRVGRTTAPVGNRASSEPTRTTAVGDQVRLSDDAQLMQTAMELVKQAPDIRQDLVERMRAALGRGEIGSDPERLADALIDVWIATK